tara:strand:- start:1002 stop:1190 length:189 start_codon:yes stop_codon:yes gene_type:complete
MAMEEYSRYQEKNMCRVLRAMEMGTLVTKEPLQPIVAIVTAKGKFRSNLLTNGLVNNQENKG